MASPILVLLVMPTTLYIFRIALSERLALSSCTLILLVITVIFSLGSRAIVSILLSVESTLFLNYYLTPPFHSFRVATSGDIVTLIVYIFASISVSGLINLIVTKQSEIENLMKRLENVKARSNQSPEASYLLGHWQIDFEKRTISSTLGESSHVHLTPIEWQLLEVLSRAEGGLVKQEQILKAVWGEKYEKETNYLRLYLSQLRKKLEASPKRPELLLTESGSGYRAIAHKVSARSE